jgi:phenylacetate-coenzyme A ligase PaaK-like adenylate-forming protein
MVDSNAATGADAVEWASCDEIQAFQLARLKWSIGHAYDNVPATKRKYDAQRGVLSVAIPTTNT